MKILASDKNINFTSRANPYASMADRPGYVITLSSIRRNETSPLVRHKTFNYGDSILAKRQARAEGIDEPIFCNMQGQLTEGAVSNLFFIKNGRLYTPPVEAGLLPGIIRSYLCQCYDVIEKPLYQALVSGRYPNFRRMFPDELPHGTHAGPPLWHRRVSRIPRNADGCLIPPL